MLPDSYQNFEGIISEERAWRGFGFQACLPQECGVQGDINDMFLVYLHTRPS